MDRRGRPSKIYPQLEIDNIVYRFTQEEKVSGFIKYLDVFRFSKDLFEAGDIPYKLSEDYWRRDGRQGRETIDNINKLYESTLVNEKVADSTTIIDTEEVVNKLCTCKPSEKKMLIQVLKINEKKAKDLGKLIIEKNELNKVVTTQKNKIKELTVSLEQIQTVMFSWFNASIKTDVPLINLMTVGKSKHPIIDLFFETAFSNPVEGYEKFDEFRNKRTKSEIDSTKLLKDNVVTPMRKSRIQEITEKYNKK